MAVADSSPLVAVTVITVPAAAVLSTVNSPVLALILNPLFTAAPSLSTAAAVHSILEASVKLAGVNVTFVSFPVSTSSADAVIAGVVDCVFPFTFTVKVSVTLVLSFAVAVIITVTSWLNWFCPNTNWPLVHDVTIPALSWDVAVHVTSWLAFSGVRFALNVNVTPPSIAVSSVTLVLPFITTIASVVANAVGTILIV